MTSPLRHRWVGLVVLVAVAGALTTAAPKRADAVPRFVQQVVARYLEGPTAMAVAPDGRVFIAEQNGAIRVVSEAGDLLSTPFVTVPTVASNEQGVVGLTLDPNFATNGYVYVAYTVVTTPSYQRVVRYTAAGNVANLASETEIFTTAVSPNALANHMGGALDFRADGKLYIAVGEGMVGVDQQLDTLSGKILRINADGSIPSDNPFYGVTTGDYRAIWAKGMRNPYTAAVDPVTDRYFVNDVGQFAWEEINDMSAGANYGWPLSEGPTVNAGETAPLHAYDHSGGRCAIVGGTFYRATNWPSAYQGRYLFTDHCTRELRTLDLDTLTASSVLTVDGAAPVDLEVGPDGAVYALTRGRYGTGTGSAFRTGRLYRITWTTSDAPIITSEPEDARVGRGTAATFTVAASGAGLTYQWQRNGVPISGATAASYTTPPTTLADDGTQFRVVVANGAGTDTSREAVLSVPGGAPVITSMTPAVGVTYVGGKVLKLKAVANDPDGDPLLYSFRVDLIHQFHEHPMLAPTPPSSLNTFTYTVPRNFHTDTTSVTLRVTATVTDGTLADVENRTLVPKLATLRLLSNPSGAGLTIDGQPITAPIDILIVAGMERVVSAVSPQAISGTSYRWLRWSNGKPQTQTVRVPTTGKTLTATFTTP